MATLTEIAATLKIDTKQFKQELKSADKALGMFRNGVGSLNKAMNMLVIGGIAATVAGLGKLAAETVKTGTAFQKSLATLGAIKGFTDLSDATSDASKSMAILEKTARDLGKSTAFSATEASNAMIELARAGLTATEVSNAIAPSLFLAGGSAASLSEATALMAATMKQFGLDATQTTRIADVFTIAQQNTQLSMESLTNAMKFAGTVGSSLGLSLEETTAAVGMFRDLGVQGATAGTQFRQMMIGLAAPTNKAEKALDRYNLKVEDVNPNVKSFREIIETLAKSNMGLADITDIVGKRASGSVTKLVQQFKLAQNSIDGTRFKYDELLDSFEKGGGSAEKTYNAMIDNVAGRFDILKSAFEEFQLTIFDTFADPLKEVLGEDDGGLIGLVNTFTEVFQSSSQVFKSLFADIFGETLKNINENQIEIATGFVTIVTQAVRLTKFVVELIPYFITLGKVIATAVVVGGAMKLAGAIQVIIVGVKGAIVAFTGLRAAMQALIVSSGGIFPLIAGFTALVAAVSAFAFMSAQAAKEQKNLRQSIEASRNAAEGFNKAAVKGQRDGVSTGVEATRDLNEVEKELRLNDELTDSMKRNFATLNNMTTAAQNKAIADGKLFSVMANGKKILVDHAMALSLENSSLNENGKISEQLNEQQERVNSQREKSAELMRNDLDAIDDMREALRKFNDGQITQIELGVLAAQATGNFSQELADVTRNGSNAARVLGEMTNKADGSIIAFQKADTAATNFNDTLEMVGESRRKEEEKAEEEAQQKEKERRSKAINDYRKAYKKATEARLKLEQGLQDQLDVLRAHETEKQTVILEQQFKNVREVYEEELKLVGRNTKKKLAIERDYIIQLRGLTEQSTATLLEQQRKSAEELERQNIRFSQNEIERIKASQQERIKAELDTFEQLTNQNDLLAKESIDRIEKQIDDEVLSIGQGIDQITQIEEKQRQDNMTALKSFQAIEKQIKLDGERKLGEEVKAINEEIANSRLEIAQKTVLQDLQIQQDAQMKAFISAGATNKQIESLQQVHADKRKAIEEDVVNSFVKPFGEYTEKIDKLNSDLNGKLSNRNRERLEKEKQFLEEKFQLEQKLANVQFQTGGLNEEDRSTAIARVQSEIDNLDKEFKGSAEGFGRGLLEGVKKVIPIMKSLFSGVISFAKEALSKIGSSVSTGLSFFTGGALTTDIGGILSQGANASMQAREEQQGQRTELQEQLKTGAISQGQFDQQISNLDEQIDPSAIAEDFINNLVDNARNFAISIAEQAPLIIDGLAVAIPQLIDVLVEQIPKFIIALGEGLPTVVLSLVDGIIELLPVLADALINNALPNIVNGIVILLSEKLPQLAETLTPIVQDLIQLILTEVPKIVNAIVSGLPSVIDFLVQGITDILTGIPQLLSTLLAAIPTIITEILGGVGEIVKAVFGAIPLIINEVILALPDILNSLIVGLLGIIVEIAKELPALIAALVDALPLLLDAILTLIPDIIIALVEAIPLIIEGIIDGLPLIIESIITLIPKIIVSIINVIPQLATVLVSSIFLLVFKSIPRLVLSLVTGIIEGVAKGITGIIDVFREFGQEFPNKIREAFEFLKEIPQNIQESLREAFTEFRDFFGDVIKEIVSLGKKETSTFGDTPHAIKAGSSGLRANFAANDYIIAAQRPMDLLRQAMESVGSNFPQSLTSSVAKAFPPQQTTSSQPSSSTTNVNIIAEGRLLDEIQIKALDRGHAPKMERKLKRNRGTKVGFDRGRFNQFSS